MKRQKPTKPRKPRRGERLRERSARALTEADQIVAQVRDDRSHREAEREHEEKPPGTPPAPAEGAALPESDTPAAAPGLSSSIEHAVLAAALDPIITIDACGNIQSASDSVQRVFGWSPAELVGRNVSVLLPEPHHGAHDGYLANYRLTGRTNILGRTREFEAVRKGGEQFPISLSVSRVDRSGELPLFVGIIRDISEQKRLERELRLVQDLALSISQAASLPAALEDTLRRICTTTRWDYGEVWMPAAEIDGELEVAATWMRPGLALEEFAATVPGLRIAQTAGLVGNVWTGQRPVWIGDLATAQNPSLRRLHAAMNAGIRAAAAVPILSEDRTIAVLLFFVRQTRTEDLHLLELVRTALAPLGTLIQRKRAEEALRATEHRLHGALQAASAGAWYWDLVRDRAWWSDEMYDLWGVERGAVIGSADSFELIHEEDRPGVRAAIDRAIADRADYQCEFRVVHRKRGVRWMTSRGRLTCDVTGVPVKIMGFSIDITERKRTEEALEHSEEQMRAAFDLAAVGQCQLDTQRRVFLRVNPKLCEITGYSARELLGLSFSDLTHPDDRAAHADVYQNAVQSGLSSYAVEKRYVRKDGSVVWVRVTYALLRDDSGHVYRVLAMVEDVSQRKRMESDLARHSAELESLVEERTRELHRSHEQLRIADRLASIGTLAAGLGHDMNNVLLPVRAHLNALRRQTESEGLSPSGLRHIDAVRKSAAYLQQLADGLHFLAADPDREQGPHEATELSSWWSQAGPLVARTLPKHVKIKVSIPAELAPVAVPTPGLTQAVLNLVVNAGQAIPAGRKRFQGAVRITARAEPDGRRVRLSVADNGTGMTEEVKQRAFEMFFTTKPRGLGTGLGLALVRKVTMSAGGAVEIESTPGKGTTVSLLLPTTRSLSASAPETRARVVAVSIDDGRPAALVVNLLRAAGASAEARAEPEAADVWVLEPRPDRLHRARSWLAERPGARVVLFGSPTQDPTEWSALGHATVRQRDDLQELRAALGRALADT